ncbi:MULTISPECIES: CopD family protein [Legionella]|uniref:Uncharacterized protein n=1 Tax=Legionella maceachernii TaxID=466 RepID=A0A0W0WGA0_9GAMM|nr:CopD family protein [Legionella maceachernii]KTD31310.1 hypothetical protein Lmac_0364 [Legionella maceachernii]SJZ99989.1 hypothetical protein SAMN02745128_01724 [Legionella maceachernii]SUP01296.1 Uncharacterised protein [Legionella maceachernii]
MGWDELKKQFQIALEQKYLDTSESRRFFNLAHSKNSHFFTKGKKFLKSIEELRNLFIPSTQSLFDDILDAATELLKDPSKDSHNLINNFRILEKKIQNRESIKTCTGGFNFVANSTFAAAGVTLATGGLYTIYNSIALLAAGGILAASGGPLLWLAIGLGATMIGLFIAGMTAYDAYTNYRYYKENQIREIKEFVHLLNPNCAANGEDLERSLSEGGRNINSTDTEVSMREYSLF